MVTERELQVLSGRTIEAISRLFYVFNGAVRRAQGGIQISFDDTTVVLLEGGGDGETLFAEYGGWIDPFASPLSAENEKFVAESGKWGIFDVSGEHPYSAFIGQVVTKVEPTFARQTKISGCSLTTRAGTLEVLVEFDETVVRIID